MAEPDSNRISKGEVCRLCLAVENRCFLPSPFIAFTMKDCVSLKCETATCLVSVMGFSREEFEVEYTARICGSSRIGMEQVAVRDYFGLFSFRVKLAAEQELYWQVGVIPEVTELSVRDERAAKIILASARADNSEDSIETAVASVIGFPGYENREYLPGDPLKRMNWKLSAKREKLLVRLDDESPGLSVNVVLDSVFAHEQLQKEMLPPDLLLAQPEELLPMVAQAAVEDSLGLAQVLMQCNYTVVYYMHGKKQWEAYRLMQERDLQELRKALADYAFVEKEAYPGTVVKERMPYDVFMTEKETLMILCTPCADTGLEQEIKAKTGVESSEMIIYPVTG